MEMSQLGGTFLVALTLLFLLAILNGLRVGAIRKEQGLDSKGRPFSTHASEEENEPFSLPDLSAVVQDHHERLRRRDALERQLTDFLAAGSTASIQGAVELNHSDPIEGAGGAMDTKGKFHPLDLQGKIIATGQPAPESWPRFALGEEVALKGWRFKVVAIGHSGLRLRAVPNGRSAHEPEADA